MNYLVKENMENITPPPQRSGSKLEMVKGCFLSTLPLKNGRGTKKTTKTFVVFPCPKRFKVNKYIIHPLILPPPGVGLFSPYFPNLTNSLHLRYNYQRRKGKLFLSGRVEGSTSLPPQLGDNFSIIT